MCVDNWEEVIAAAYTLYEILRILVERVGWRDETEKRIVMESITALEQVNIFGNLATIIECEHTYSRNQCTKCARRQS